MASTIAAITTGTGGVVTTADSSGNLSLLSGVNTVVALTSTGVSVTGTLAVSGGVTLTTTLPVLQGGTGVTTSTGTGAVVLGTSPTLVTPLLGTPTSGVLTNCTGLPVAGGGTGVATTTAYGVLAGGTTATGAFQNIGTGTSAQVLTSNGAGALPTFQAASGGVTTIGFGTTGLTPSGATSGAVTVAGTLAVASGGTGVTTSTGTGAGVHSVGPSISSAVMTTMASSVLTSATVQATTSGTFKDFTGIPSWVKRITVMFQGVNTNGASSFLVQLGVSATPTTTGYVSAYTYVQINVGNTSGGATTTAGFNAHHTASNQIYSGTVSIFNITGNTWVASQVGGVASGGGATVTSQGGGQVTLGGVLGMVRVTTVTPDTFTAGSVNILYE